MNKSNNRAKFYQLALFPLNNGATNVYHLLTLNYIAYYAGGVLGLTVAFATVMVTVMRGFDALTDPFIGALIDRTDTRIGKFRPFMIAGNIIMALSSIGIYFVTRTVPKDILWARYTLYILFYAIYVIGYTFQTAVTRSAQSALTNDPHQRPLFTVFNMISSLIGMGAIMIVAPLLGGFNNPRFFDIMVPLAITLSAIMTILSVIGIAKKDRPEFWGLTNTRQRLKLRDYFPIIRKNKELRRLMVAGGTSKLAASTLTSMPVLCMLYGGMMGNYKGLYLPLMLLGYIFAVPFFILTVRSSRKYGLKHAFVRYTSLSLVMFFGVLILLIIWQKNVPSLTLSLFDTSNGFKLTINPYTVLFLICFGTATGCLFATTDMPIPMVADCSDYQTYISGEYIPGIIGTLFSLVDKLVSGFGSTIVGITVGFIGFKNALPDDSVVYSPGMKTVVIFLFCILPISAWAITLLSMKKYSLTGERMKQIQTVNAKRKEAIRNGMNLTDAIEKYK